MNFLRIAAAGAVLALPVLGSTAGHAEAQAATLTIESSAFAEGADIPMRNSAYEDNLSPELTWSGVPEGTESFAVVLHDSDVPMPNGFVHWVIYNIPGEARGLPEGIPADQATLTAPAEVAGATQGVMGMRNPGYFGPRPPAGGGVHNYHFTVYALDADLELAAGLNRDEVIAAIEGHILGQGQVSGVFEQEG